MLVDVAVGLGRNLPTQAPASRKALGIRGCHCLLCVAPSDQSQKPRGKVHSCAVTQSWNFWGWIDGELQHSTPICAQEYVGKGRKKARLSSELDLCCCE